MRHFLKLSSTQGPVSHRIIFALFSLSVLFMGVDCRHTIEVPRNTVRQLRISFNNLCNGKPLVLGSSYLTDSGESLTISRLRYYISNVRLRNLDSGFYYYQAQSYHLLEAGGNTSILLTNLPDSGFNQLEFSVGVDNAANHDIDQIADLDPTLGMAWDWNTGYKFLVLEGSWKKDTAQGNLVVHVGTDANFRTVKLSLAALPGKRLTARPDSLIEVGLNADCYKVFSGPRSLSLRKAGNIQQDVTLSKQAADNYAAGMFTLQGVKVIR